MKKLALFAFIISGLAGVQAAPVTQYSADQVVTGKGGARTAKVHVDNGKVRTEMNVDGRRTINIVRVDRKVMYMVMPAQSMYMEHRIRPEDEMVARSYEKDAKREAVGTETVKGQPCTKYKITHGGNVVYLWTNKTNEAPVQMLSADNKTRIEWNNVKVGPQPASLFEPPAGYQKMGMPAGVPG